MSAVIIIMYPYTHHILLSGGNGALDLDSPASQKNQIHISADVALCLLDV